MYGLYWWRKGDQGKNLGDEITSIIFKDLFGVSFSRASYPGADILGAGSILGWMYERRDMKARSKKLHVCGSGLMHPWVEPEKLDFVKFYFVRGYLTKNILSNVLFEGCGIGDPGLLISDLIDGGSQLPKRKKFKYDIGLIPHCSRVEDSAFLKKFDQIESVAVIDYRTDDAISVAMKMLECRVILSQGLHGLIFADSLGIPNAWLDAGALHRGAEFKFYDYFSSVGRPFHKKINARGGKVLSDDVYRAVVNPGSDFDVSEVKEGIVLKINEMLSEIGANGFGSNT